jgi:hypothetical protein
VGIGETLAPRLVKPLTPPRLQLAPFRLAENVGELGKLEQNAALMLTGMPTMPNAERGRFVVPPTERPSAVLAKNPQDAITKTKPDLASMLVAFEGRAVVTGA